MNLLLNSFDDHLPRVWKLQRRATEELHWSVDKKDLQPWPFHDVWGLGMQKFSPDCQRCLNPAWIRQDKQRCYISNKVKRLWRLQSVPARLFFYVYLSFKLRDCEPLRLGFDDFAAHTVLSWASTPSTFNVYGGYDIAFWITSTVGPCSTRSAWRGVRM